MASEELIGRTIADGRYEIVRLLGEGGMGAVYQARQVAMDRMVALKLILSDLVRSAAAVARFQREMKLTARIEHPNTIRVYDFGETEGRLFLTMELLRGKTLKQVLAESGRLELDRIVRIATQVTRALQAAHSEGVVHRDLKPDNIMLLEQYGERDIVKVLDFGIAKSLDEHERGMTSAGAVVGTPAYMSAEQAMGHAVDPRSDLYSLGIILYEMASGRVPFTAPALTALLLAHATELPTPLAHVVPGVHPGLASLVDELLRKDPAERPQSAKAIERRLEALVGGAAVSATIPVPVAPVPATIPVVTAPGMSAAVAAAAPGVAAAAPTRPGVRPPPPSKARWLWPVIAVIVVGGGIGAAVMAGGSGGQASSATGQTGGTATAVPAQPSTPTTATPPATPTRPTTPGPSPEVLARLAAATQRLAGFGDPAPPDACPPEAAAHAAELVIEAREAVAADPSRAIAATDQALQRCPSLAAAHNVRGNALQKAGKLEDAGDAYARALQFAPDYEAPRFNLGVVQLRRRDPAAIATFSEIVRRKPDDPDAYKSRAQAYVNAARYDEALADLEEGLRRKPDDGRAWQLLGALREQTRKGRARDAYCKAAALGVSEAAAHCKK
jgi:serine/threonine-protein kinase